METYAGLAVDCGASIVGGCCGNTAAHVAAIRRGLDGARRGTARPSRRSSRRSGPGLAAVGRGARRARPPPGADVRARSRRAAPGDDEVAIEADVAKPAPLVDASGRRPSTSTRRAGERLDRFLGQAAAARGIALSRTRLKALIEAGEVRVDGGVARDPAAGSPRARASPSTPPPPEDSPLAGEDLPLAVVYEDEHLIVIDKPAGLVVHPAPGHADGHAGQRADPPLRRSLSGIGGVRRPGIVHRLDKDTSGLLVVAKTDAAHQGLADLFADHGRTGSLEREYLALVWGGFDAQAGKVDAPIGRDPRHRERMAVRARGARPPRRDPLAPRGRPRPGEPHRLPAGDRADPSDPGPYGVDRSPAPRRSGLWRRVQDQGRLLEPGRAGGARRSAARRCTQRPGFRAPGHRRDAPLREPAARRFCAACSTHYELRRRPDGPYRPEAP